MLAPQAAQAFDAEVFAAAGFEPVEQDHHGAQFLADLWVDAFAAAVCRVGIEKVANRCAVAQVNAALGGKLGDQPAQGLHVFRMVARFGNWAVHRYLPSSCPALARRLDVRRVLRAQVSAV